jgi:hypothetical protein
VYNDEEEATHDAATYSHQDDWTDKPECNKLEGYFDVVEDFAAFYIQRHDNKVTSSQWTKCIDFI